MYKYYPWLPGKQLKSKSRSAGPAELLLATLPWLWSSENASWDAFTALVLPWSTVSQVGCGPGVWVGFFVNNWAMQNSWFCFDFCIINSAFHQSRSTLRCTFAWIFTTVTSFVLFTWNLFSSSCFCAVSSSIFATSENRSMMFLDFVCEGHVGILVVSVDKPVDPFVLLVGLLLGPLFSIADFSFLIASFSSRMPMS